MIRDGNEGATVLNAKEICALIRACGEAGVSELEFDQLRLKFHEPAQTGPVWTMTYPTAQTDSADPGTTKRKRKSKQGEPVFFEEQQEFPFIQDELNVREDQLELMRIENPAEYERLLAQGELEDAE